MCVCVCMHPLLSYYRPGTFKLLATGDPFSNELRFIVRVFVATHEQLQKYFNEKGELQGVTELLAPWHRTDVKTLDFLEKRYMYMYVYSVLSR